jgi:hypothetical protein
LWTGQNFGIGGTILVGSLPCTNPSITHTSATCVIPAGNRLDVAVLLIQYNGDTSSASSITLSYTQCDKGTYENGTSCPSCAKGTYTAFKGLTRSFFFLFFCCVFYRESHSAFFVSAAPSVTKVNLPLESLLNPALAAPLVRGLSKEVHTATIVRLDCFRWER